MLCLQGVLPSRIKQKTGIQVIDRSTWGCPFHPLILGEPNSHPNLFSQTLTSGSPSSYPKNYPTVPYPTKHPHIPGILSVLPVLPRRSCPSKWARRRWKPHGAPEFGNIQSKKRWKTERTMATGFNNGWHVWFRNILPLMAPLEHLRYLRCRCSVHLFNSCRLWMFSPHQQNIWSG